MDNKEKVIRFTKEDIMRRFGEMTDELDAMMAGCDDPHNVGIVYSVCVTEAMGGRWRRCKVSADWFGNRGAALAAFAGFVSRHGDIAGDAERAATMFMPAEGKGGATC